ncbi:hypothetical protein CEXT_300561 [Caerostris extrusa]|uniref:Uncharacterized protein n=1 Tax=Caerostris extrusa TaxID=172846 RepID=A0AAV4PZZ2_CAEEX|nr:hypothetical protein CEXT_300561 [Caerostris extrusa]
MGSTTMYPGPRLSSNDLHFRTLSFRPKLMQKSETIANCLDIPSTLSAMTIMSSANPKASQFLGSPAENDTITTVLQATDQRSTAALNNSVLAGLPCITPPLLKCMGSEYSPPGGGASVRVRIEVPKDLYVRFTRTQAVQSGE